jgi:hypothetical protein
MRCLRICLLFLAVAYLPSAIPAQQPQEPDSTKTAAPAAQTSGVAANKPKPRSGDVEIPKSKERWTVPGDITTGLDPLPPARVQVDDKSDFVRELLRLQWRLDDTIDVWLIRPKVEGKVPTKVPVIFYIYSYPDAGQNFRDDGWCQRVTASGFAAVGFVPALTDYRFKNRPLRESFISELPEALGSTTHDVLLVLNHLATRGDLNTHSVGIFGVGSGATVAILAAAADPRITSLDALDPWGDWADWFKDSPSVPDTDRGKYRNAEFLQSLATLDPVSVLGNLKTPNIRLQQNVNEPVTPSVAKEKIASAAPERATLVKYQTVQDLLNAWKAAGLSGWLKQQLQPKASKGAGVSSALQSSAKD